MSDTDTGGETTTNEGGVRIRRFDADLIASLAAGLTQEQAATRAGCSVATVERRLNEPDFRMEVITALQERRDALLAQSVTAASRASAFLVEVVLGRVEGASVPDRVRAAAHLLRANGYIDRDRI